MVSFWHYFHYSLSHYSYSTVSLFVPHITRSVLESSRSHSEVLFAPPISAHISQWSYCSALNPAHICKYFSLDPSHYTQSTAKELPAERSKTLSLIHFLLSLSLSPTAVRFLPLLSVIAMCRWPGCSGPSCFHLVCISSLLVGLIEDGPFSSNAVCCYMICTLTMLHPFLCCLLTCCALAVSANHRDFEYLGSFQTS